MFISEWIVHRIYPKLIVYYNGFEWAVHDTVMCMLLQNIFRDKQAFHVFGNYSTTDLSNLPIWIPYIFICGIHNYSQLIGYTLRDTDTAQCDANTGHKSYSNHHQTASLWTNVVISLIIAICLCGRIPQKHPSLEFTRTFTLDTRNTRWHSLWTELVLSIMICACVEWFSYF